MRRKFDSCQGCYNWIMREITYQSLWNGWTIADTNDPVAILVKEKINEYSKEDWKVISEEAKKIIKSLGELVLHNTPVESKTAETGFDILIEHFKKWFFPINKTYLLKFAYACKHSHAYSKFFDQFYPGLSNYLYKLLPAHAQKVLD